MHWFFLMANAGDYIASTSTVRSARTLITTKYHHQQKEPKCCWDENCIPYALWSAKLCIVRHVLDRNFVLVNCLIDDSAHVHADHRILLFVFEWQAIRAQFCWCFSQAELSHDLGDVQPQILWVFQGKQNQNISSFFSKYLSLKLGAVWKLTDFDTWCVTLFAKKLIWVQTISSFSQKKVTISVLYTKHKFDDVPSIEMLLYWRIYTPAGLCNVFATLADTWVWRLNI